MDVNGTKFHLLTGWDDWKSCLVGGRDRSLGELAMEPSAAPPDLAWVVSGGYLGLRSEPQLFQQAVTRDNQDSVQFAERFGAAHDEFGVWYWIDPRQYSVQRLRPNQAQPEMFYPAPPTASPPNLAPYPGGFTPVPSASPASAPSLILRGMAITTHHELVVGFLPQNDRPGGLLVFDIYQTGGLLTPRVISFAPGDDFTLRDMAPTPDGGLLLIGERQTGDSGQRLWRLFNDLKPPGVPSTGSAFQPADDPTGTPVSGPRAPVDRPLDRLPGTPVSVAAGPADGALVLCDPGSPLAPSVLVFCYGDDLGGYCSQPLAVTVHDDATNTTVPDVRPVRAADMTYVDLDPANPEGIDWLAEASTLAWTLADALADETSHTGEKWLPRLLPVGIVIVIDQTGNQAVAYALSLERDAGAWVADPFSLSVQSDYLPMRHWAGCGLVRRGGQVFYDYSPVVQQVAAQQVRWLPLMMFGDPRYAQHGVLLTPIDFPADLPVQPFDGETTGCVWHRLLVDADLPAGTRITARARAADTIDALPYEVWREQPSFLLRSSGSDLPFYTLPALRPRDPAAVEDHTVGDELAQESQAMPARTGAVRAGTWELLLQEVRGRYVQFEITLEGTGAATPRLYALRAWYPRFSYLTYLPAIYREHPVHSDFLDRFLANFEGLLTSLEDQIEQVAMLFDPRIAPADALDWLASWMGLLLDPAWKETQRRFFIRHALAFYRQRGTLPGLMLALRLYLEDAPTDALLEASAAQDYPVRLLELVLQANAGQAVDPGDDEQALKRAEARRQAAHRFVVRVPAALTDTEVDMIARIVRQEKPAHTDFDIERRDDAVVICGAFLGLDSRLSPAQSAGVVVLGSSALAYSTLSAEYPDTITDRMVIARDVLRESPRFAP